jgi:hypothetical protein
MARSYAASQTAYRRHVSESASLQPAVHVLKPFSLAELKQALAVAVG